MDSHFDVVVVGGGLAGLTAAATAARAGRRVCVLEKSQSLGGFARTTVRDGFYLNQGPHALYLTPESLSILDALDVPLPGKKNPVGTHGWWQKQVVAMPSVPSTMLTTPILSAREKMAQVGLMAKLMTTRPSSINDCSWQDWLTANTRPGGLRQWADALARISTYTNAPALASAGFVIHQIQVGIKLGVMYIDGGWQTLVDGLQASAETHGAQLFTGVRVESVRSGEVVLTDGGCISAEAIILAVPPSAASQLVGAHNGLTRQAETAVPVRAAVWDLALRDVAPSTNFVLGIDEPLYLSVHSATAEVAPPNGSMIHLAKYLAPDDSGESARAELEALLDAVVADWRSAVVYQRFLPSMTVVNRLPLASEGGLSGRPGYAVAGLSGVYVAGDWVGSEGWLAGASLASGRNSAELALSESLVGTLA